MKWRKVRNYIKHANQSVIVETGYQGHCHSSSHHKEKPKSNNGSPKIPVSNGQTRWGMLRSKYRSASGLYPMNAFITEISNLTIMS